MIGTLGKGIVFETSDTRILTPGQFSRTTGGRWSTHAVIGEKPKPEFSGPDLQGITFTIKLRADLGVKPRQVLWTLEHMAETGAAELLIIGGTPLGNKWTVTGTSETWDVIMSGGELFSATVSVTLAEYV